MDDDAGMIPSSPSAETSSSSSDIDTESTCSFFRDRSTTLGTLMGVSLAADGEDMPQPEAAAAARDAAAAEEEEENTDRARAPAEEERWRWRRRRWRRPRGASWWRLCRDDGGGATPLAHFLDMERREATAPLFEQRRRAPPSSSSTPTPTVGEERGSGRLKLRRSLVQGTSSSSLARLPVLLTGICSGRSLTIQWN